MKNNNDNYLDFNNAQSCVDRYIQMVYNNESLYFDIEELEEIIEYFIEKHDYVKALKAANYGTELHQFSPTLILRKADLLASMGKHDEALALIDTIEHIDPSNTDLYMIKASIYSELDFPEKAIQYYLLCAKNSDENLDDIYMDISYEYQARGEFSKAIEFLKKALHHNPENEEALFEAAYCFEESDHIEEGIEFFHLFIDEFPYCYQAWFNLGLFQGIAGNYKQAIDSYDFVIAIKDDHIPAHYEKAHALLLLKKHEEALLEFSETIRLDPDNFTAYFYLGQCYGAANNESKALASYSKAVKLNNNFDYAWLEMAKLLESNNKHIDAVFHVKKAVETNESSAENWFVFARIHNKLGMIEESKFAFDKVVNIEPSGIDYWMEYGDMLYENDYFNECIETINEAIKINPESAELYYKKSAYFLSEGFEEEAQESLTEAFGLDFNMHRKLFEFLPQSKNNIFVAELISSYSNL